MQETPLTPWHRQQRAKMMEFGGFLMPIEYGTGILEEHAIVRQKVGAFDVSHMGEFLVSGENVLSFLDYLVTNQPSTVAVGQALYTPMCYPTGGTVDDLLIYRLDATRFMLVVNASNIEKDWQWVNEVAAGFKNVELQNVSDRMGLIAVQGPMAQPLVQKLVDFDLSDLVYYHARYAAFGSSQVLVSRTGYTGEDGFELYADHEALPAIWDKVMELGAKPIGLGARDTLRLEARLPLYGHELSADISPLEAGLAPFVKLGKEDFVGKAALAAQKAQGLTRRTVGLALEGGIARPGYPVVSEPSGTPIGQITSGTKSPTLGHPIALALVNIEFAKVGTSLFVQMRGRDVPATVVKTPFYRKPAQG